MSTGHLVYFYFMRITENGKHVLTHGYDYVVTLLMTPLKMGFI